MSGFSQIKYVMKKDMKLICYHIANCDEFDENVEIFSTVDEYLEKIVWKFNSTSL